MSEKISPTDYKILNYLIENDFENYTKMGKKSGIPASTIYSRLISLRKKGIIKKLGPVIDLEKFGYNILAALEVEVHNMREVDDLKNRYIYNQNIVGLFKMSGNYDLLVLGLFKSPTDLENLINELLKQPEVKDVHGNLSIHTYKFTTNPFPLKED